MAGCDLGRQVSYRLIHGNELEGRYPAQSPCQPEGQDDLARAAIVLAFLIVVPMGILFTTMGGITASVICLVLSPFAGKLLLNRLHVFNDEEMRQILDLIPFAYARRTAAWLMSAGGRLR